MGINRRIALLAVVITAVVISAVASGFTIETATGAPPQGTSTQDGRYFEPWPMPNSSGNVTIDSEQAKATVEASISSFTIGTPILHGTSWDVPIEDAKGVVASIEVATISASTAEQAKSVVGESLGKGWKAGEPTLMRTIYNVPLIDSNEATVAYVMVDGSSGEIMTRPSTPPTVTTESITLTVTSEQAKSIVSDAVKALQVGEANDSGTVWVVSIKYKDMVVMTVLLGKVNTPTSGDAVKAVQDSMSKGWSAGEPKQLGFSYNVPIIDANGNAIGNIRVDGSTGEITPGFGRTGDIAHGLPPPHR
jgi:nitrogen regulatory protein PII